MNHVDILESFSILFKNNAKSLILKASEEKFLLQEWRSVLRPNFEKAISESLIRTYDAYPTILNGPCGEVTLTKKESECIYEYLKGRTSKEIGLRLDISHKTFEKHIENIKFKLGLNTKSQLFDFIFNNEQNKRIYKAIL